MSLVGYSRFFLASPPIGQALPSDLLKRLVRALRLCRLALVVAEIELVGVAVQVRARYVVVCRRS